MSSILLASFLGLATCCLLITAVLLLLVLTIFKKKDKADFNVHSSTDGKSSRRLGLLEQVLLEREKVNNWGTVTSALLLDSTQELNQDNLRKALGLLAKRYPLLRMRIKETDDGTYFEEMENPDTVD